MLYDEIGGTLEPTATFGSGKTSRSLLAVYQVRATGTSLWLTRNDSQCNSHACQSTATL